MSKVQELLTQRENEEKKETSSVKESVDTRSGEVHVVDRQKNLIECRKQVKELMCCYDSDDVMYDICRTFSKILKAEINKNYH